MWLFSKFFSVWYVILISNNSNLRIWEKQFYEAKLFIIILSLWFYIKDIQFSPRDWLKILTKAKSMYQASYIKGNKHFTISELNF